MSVSNGAQGLARGGLSALAVIAILGTGVAGSALVWSGGPAIAQGHESGGGRGQGPGPGSAGRGGSGGHDDGGHSDGGHSGGGHSGGGHSEGGHDDGGHDDGGHEDGGHSGGGGGGSGGSGRGGSGGEQGGSGGQGQGRAPHGSDGESGGGRPPWAAEGIPEVELGRLNVARSPDQVFDRAYAEAVAQLPAMSGFYNLPLSGMIAELRNNWDTLAIIDSPLQNLALFRDALDGQLALSAYGINNDRTTLMSVFLGVATDKAIPVTAQTVQALSIIMGMPVSGAEAQAIAAGAEAIRQAVVLGHS